jgi:hypothetical protein
MRMNTPHFHLQYNNRVRENTYVVKLKIFKSIDMLNFYPKMGITLAALLLGTEAFSQCITPPLDQTVTPANTNIICSGSASINVASTENGVNYYLRNYLDNSIVAGPIAGTGNAISFNTGKISTNTTFNVYAEATSGNSGIDLPGSDDHIRFISPYTSYGNKFTVEAWVNFNNNENPWAGQSTFQDQMSTNVWLWHAGGFFVNDGGEWRSLDFPTTIPSGWIHVATVANPNGLFIYYNGVLVASNTNGISTGILNVANSFIDLGHDPRFPAGETGRNTNTAFDDFRVWNVTRTSDEILSNMNTCLSGTETGLVQYTVFNEGTGTSISSLVGSSATLVNPSDNWIIGAGLQLTSKSSITINSISDQTISPESSSLICGGNSSVSLTSTETGISYYLRNDADDAIVAGPIKGTGSAITFNTGTITSSTVYNVFAEKTTGGLTFDGVNDYVMSPMITLGSVFTYETWVKTDDASPEWSGIITSNTRSGTGMFTQLSLSNTGTLRWEASNPNIQILNMPTVINDNVWHHVAVVSTGSELTFYVDGDLEYTTSFAAGSFTRNMHFMAEREANGFIPGKMDEARIWSVARTQSEIQSSMKGCDLTGTETGLEIYYTFENGAGSTLTDISGGDYDGALTNMDENAVWSDGLTACNCTTEMLTKPSVSVTEISDQEISATQLVICKTGSTTIDVASSETTVDYYLRNDLNDTIVAGPIAGTGAGLMFSTGKISTTTTYNVLAERVQPNTALNFDGGAEHISIPSGINIANQSFTIEFWAKRSGSGVYEFVIGQQSGTDNQALHIGFRNNNAFTFAFYNNDLDVSNSANTDGNYHHWSCVYKAGTSGMDDRFIYLDGVLIASDDAPADYSGIGEFFIGSNPFSTDYFNGDIDEVRVWNRVLTASEIKDEMNNCLSGTESDLLAYYSMNGITEPILNDLSGNGHNGAIKNMEPSDVVDGIELSHCTYCETEMAQKATVSINNTPVDVTTTQSGNTLTANLTGATYEWIDCSDNSKISGETGQSFTATANGSYAVIVTENTCSETSECVAVVINGTMKFTADSQIGVYPNPNNGAFVIESNVEGTYNIVNNLGQSVQTVELNAAGNYSVEIKDLDNGVYYMVGVKDNRMTRQKIVVTK